MAFVNVDIDLSELDTEELITELEARGEEVNGFTFYESRKLVEQIYNLYRSNQDYDLELTKLFYLELGRIA